MSKDNPYRYLRIEQVIVRDLKAVKKKLIEKYEEVTKDLVVGSQFQL